MWTRILTVTCVCAALARADGPGVLESKRAAADVDLAADPNAAFWRGVKGVVTIGGVNGEPQPEARTEIRSRWTAGNLYFLFISNYETTWLKQRARVDTETWGLWEYDVVEVFIGDDLSNINVYKEFEVSPQNEWVDLDVDKSRAGQTVDWRWNSNFVSKTRLVSGRKIWICEMRIPWKSIDRRAVKPANELRLNLYRIEGGPEKRTYIAWQPTNSPSYHTPEAFGRLRLVE